jgi:hypothetical protein
VDGSLLVARVDYINQFWTEAVPSGFHPLVVRVCLPIAAEGVLALAPDPVGNALWVTCRQPSGAPTVRFFKGQTPASLRLFEQATPLSEQLVMDVAVRPIGAVLAVVEREEAYLWSLKHSAKLEKLPARVIHTSFSRNGLLLAYGTSTGQVGILSLFDNAGADAQPSKLQRAMDEKNITSGVVDRWQFGFNSKGDRLFFIVSAGSSRQCGCFDVVTGDLQFIGQPVDATNNAIDLAVATSVDPESDLVCFGGISLHVGLGARDSHELRKIRVAEQGWVGGLHLERSDLLILRQNKAVWAVDPTRCTGSSSQIIGTMPDSAPPVEQCLGIGVYNNNQGKRVLYVIASDPTSPV